MDDRQIDSQFTVTSAPHISSGESVRGIMLDVIVALIPSLGMATYFFGPRVLILAAVCMAACVLFEFLYRLLLKKPQHIGDLSACVTGLLLAMCLPANAPYWMAAVGCFFAVVVVKQLYGGIGKNFMNPALAGYVFLFSFPAFINTWVKAGTDFWPELTDTVTVITAATPLSNLRQGLLPQESLLELLVGAHSGAIGEVSSIALLLGGLYLLLRRVISLRIPLFYIGTVAVLTYLFPLGGQDSLEWMLCQLLSGSLLLGAIFMATDYVTSPVTPVGQVLFSVGCGALTVFLRYYGIYPEGVCFAILIMNAFVWLLDKVGTPHRYGTKFFQRKRKGGEQT